MRPHGTEILLPTAPTMIPLKRRAEMLAEPATADAASHHTLKSVTTKSSRRIDSIVVLTTMVSHVEPDDETNNRIVFGIFSCLRVSSESSSCNVVVIDLSTFRPVHTAYISANKRLNERRNKVAWLIAPLHQRSSFPLLASRGACGMNVQALVSLVETTAKKSGTAVRHRSHTLVFCFNFTCTATYNMRVCRSKQNQNATCPT